jgi:Bacterial Ig-like domain (group 3)
VFNGSNPDGTWSLYVITTSGGDGTGAIAGGWCLDTTIQKASLTIGTRVSSTPIVLGNPSGDTATLVGVPAGADAPTGTVTFNLYGPDDATCSSAPVFTSTIQLTGAGTTALSGDFTPTSLGTYRWIASYGGDSNYSAATAACGDANESVVIGKAATTTNLVSSLNPSLTGQAVAFTAIVSGAGPTGAVTFMDGSSTLGTGALSASGDASFTTSSLSAGSHTITAIYGADAHNAGSSSSALVQIVDNPAPGLPSVSIASPASGARFRFGQVVRASYSCGEGPNGPGIQSCNGPVPSGSPINTSKAGTHTFAVTAASKDGQTATRTVVYTVRRPSNRFKISHIRTKADGIVTFELKIPGPGVVNVLESARDLKLASGASLLKPGRDRFVFARKHVRFRRGQKIRITVRPTRAGRALIGHHAHRPAIRLAVSYTPTGGLQRNTHRSLHFPG